MPLLGIDVSEFQGRPDWAAVKASGVVFAIARVSFGATHNDLSYAYNRAAIPAAGLIPGAYHFLTSAYAAAQADFFCANADPDAIHFLDVEYAGLDVAGFVARYRVHYPKKTLLIYTGRDLWARAVGSLNGAAIGQLWLAGYRPNAYTLALQVRAAQDAGLVEDWHADVDVSHALPGRYAFAGAYEPLATKWANAQAAGISGYQFGGWTSWAFCQFSDRCTVPGISGGVDGDAFSGTLADLQALTGAAPAPAAHHSMEDQMLVHAKAASSDGSLGQGSLLLTNGRSRYPLVDIGIERSAVAAGHVVVELTGDQILAQWPVLGDPKAPAPIDPAALAAAISADVHPTVDPTAVAVALAPLLHAGASIDDIRALLATLKLTVG